jgi:hypothetical protein
MTAIGHFGATRLCENRISKHQPCRFAVEIELGTRMTAESRRWACLADRAAEGRQHRIGLARAGDHDRNHRRAQERRDRQGIGMSGHITWSLEATVVDLLSSAGCVEPDDLDENRIEEVGDRRVVERQMAVLTDSRTDDVGRLGSEQVLVSQTGRERTFRVLTRDQAKAMSIQTHEPEEMLPQVTPERSRVIGVDSQVFIHVERDDPRPVNLVVGDQAGQELVLAGRRRENDVRPSGDALAVGNGFGNAVRRRSSDKLGRLWPPSQRLRQGFGRFGPKNLTRFPRSNPPGGRSHTDSAGF